MNSTLKVALVHDWLNGMRGGEKVLEVLCELFPEADVYTLLSEKEKTSETISDHPIFTSFIDRLPGAKKYYRYFLPLFPFAVERFDLSKKNYDLVISTSHCVAKGVIPPPKAKHICYCFTPMRYAWALQQDYFGKGLMHWITAPILSALRNWDRNVSNRVGHFVGISNHIAKRIKQYYNRDADVIYPPVDTAMFQPTQDKRDYFLIVSALVPYKRIDLAVEVFNRIKLPLKIIGAGNCYQKLKAQAEPNIKFLGWQSDKVVQEHMARAKALIFPGEEDFGIVPLESLASGTPVIAYGHGGIKETMIPLSGQPVTQATGLFFYEQKVEALMQAVQRFNQLEENFDPNFLRTQAEKFNRNRFREEISTFVGEKMAQVQTA